jgi:hypothetical protein
MVHRFPPANHCKDNASKESRHERNTQASVLGSNETIPYFEQIVSCALDESEPPSNNQGDYDKKDQNTKNSKERSQAINFSPRYHDVHPKHTAHQIQWNED